MKIIALLTKCSKFMMDLNEINLIEELFYLPLTRFLFKNYQNEKWKNFMIEYKPEDSLLVSIATIFYNICKRNEFKQNFLDLLKIHNNDYVFRFLLQAIIENNFKAVFLTIFGIERLLEDESYSLPSYSEKFYFFFINLI